LNQQHYKNIFHHPISAIAKDCSFIVCFSFLMYEFYSCIFTFTNTLLPAHI